MATPLTPESAVTAHGEISTDEQVMVARHRNGAEKREVARQRDAEIIAGTGRIDRCQPRWDRARRTSRYSVPEGVWLLACSAIYARSVAHSGRWVCYPLRLAHYRVSRSDNVRQKLTFLAPEGSRQEAKRRDGPLHPEKGDPFYEKDREI